MLFGGVPAWSFRVSGKEAPGCAPRRLLFPFFCNGFSDHLSLRRGAGLAGELAGGRCFSFAARHVDRVDLRVSIL